MSTHNNVDLIGKKIPGCPGKGVCQKSITHLQGNLMIANQPCLIFGTHEKKQIYIHVYRITPEGWDLRRYLYSQTGWLYFREETFLVFARCFNNGTSMGFIFALCPLRLSDELNC